MESPVILQGDLVIVRDGGGDYTATLGGLPLDEQLAHYFQGGEYVLIKMDGEGPNVVIRGSLEIFTTKIERSYYRNGWCSEREANRLYKVRCNQRLLADRIADFFSIEENTRRLCGWYRISVEGW